MKRDALYFVFVAFSVLSFALHAFHAAALTNDPADWPKEIPVKGGSIVLYQPEPERLDGNLLSSRAAFSIKVNETGEMYFGAIWYDSRLLMDSDKRIATVSSVHVTEVRFPESQGENVRHIKSLVETEMPRWKLEIDLDRLAASLELAQKRKIAAQQINTDPPAIIFTTEPAVLVPIDGEPRLKKIEDTDLMRVINTPFTIILSQSENKYYLFAGKDTWYRSQDIMGNWQVASQVPAAIAARAPKGEGPAFEEKPPEVKELVKPGPPPVIYITTKPTELISSEGEPEYTPISRTSLLYMSNTDSDVLLHIEEQTHYVLLSGRWYRSASLSGPWEYVAGEELPSDFARIPADSQMGTVLYAVPGTKIAREAMLDAYVPQTAAVDPQKAGLTVEYDGKPEFEQIRGTDLYYAVNTETPIIWTGRWYYACDQGIWFIAPSPKGPWTVARSVPDAIYLIPPESPIYNVTYVRVYGATPNVVYFGYTPGYTHTYVYHNTIVYGTGYYWPGWYGHYYYPRPCTWGFHARWDPWWGWAFGASYSLSPYYFSIGYGGWYRGGWWGPAYYRSYRHWYHHRYRRVKHVEYKIRVPDRPHHTRSNLYRSERYRVKLTPAYDKPYIRTNELSEKWLQKQSTKPVQLKPATGPIPVYRPKQEKVKPLETRPSTSPVEIKRPKHESRKNIKITPATGPLPVKKPQQEKVQPFHFKPSTGPVSKYESGKKIKIRAANGPTKMQQQKVPYQKSFQYPRAYQLDQTHRSKPQGMERTQSYQGTMRPAKETPPSGKWQQKR